MIAGKSMPAEGDAKCFGFVQRFDTKPKRRLFEVLRSQGMQMNRQVTFVTDGGEDVRDLPLYLNPQAEHLLDWFHVTMRLTVMGQYAKSLPVVNASAGSALATARGAAGPAGRCLASWLTSARVLEAPASGSHREREAPRVNRPAADGRGAWVI